MKFGNKINLAIVLTLLLIAAINVYPDIQNLAFMHGFNCTSYTCNWETTVIGGIQLGILTFVEIILLGIIFYYLSMGWMKIVTRLNKID
jgi:hypothetical protein